MRLLLLISMVILISSCGSSPYPGYTFLKSKGMYYKVLSFEEGDVSPQQGDMIRFTMGMLKGDSLNWFTNEVQIIRFDTAAIGLKSELFHFHEGDSISILLEPNAFLKEFGKPLLDELDHADIRMRILSVIPEDIWLKNKEMDRSVKASRERSQIDDYLASRPDSASFEEQSGIWVKKVVKGSRGPFSSEEELLVMYSASLLDGTVIDEHITPEDALAYRIGMQGQLIKGLMEVISRMDRDDELEVIINSEKAFGESGSAGDVVPPWTPIRYELKVKTMVENSL